MKIDISLNSTDEARELLREFGLTICRSADRPTGWVSHPIADLTKQPPSVMTVATTECAHDDGAEPDAEPDVPEADNAQTEASPHVRLDLEHLTDLVRRDELGGSLLRRLLDFETWTDTVCAKGDDVEHVRFHTVRPQGDMLVLCCVAYYRNADRRKWPRKLVYNKPIRIAEDEDYEDELHEYVEWLFYDAIASVSEFLGANPEDYDRWLSTPPSKKGGHIDLDLDNEEFE